MTNKTAIITGGSRGIGLSIVRKLLNKKIKVFVLDKNKITDKEFDIFLKEGLLKVCHCDLSKPSNALKIFKQIINNEKNVEILINNARTKDKTDLSTESITSWNYGLNVMLTTPFVISQEFILNSGITNGSIINISSITASLISNESPVYHVAKGALNAMTRYLAVKGGKKIRVNSILPGLIIQNEHLKRFNSNTNVGYKDICENYQPMGEVGTEKDIASLVAFLSSDEAKYISGTSIAVDGGATLQEQLTLLLRDKIN